MSETDEHLFHITSASEVTQEGKNELARHGLFSGPDCITTYGPIFGKGEQNPPNFKEPPMDEVDAIAKRHDIAYELDNYQGFVEDTRTYEADIIMVKEAKEYLKDPNAIDIYTGRPKSEESLGAADDITIFIGALRNYKEWKIKKLEKMNLDPKDPKNMKKVKLEQYDKPLQRILLQMAN